ncbi:SCAN domain-containing protein 3 [Trichonephila clavipes]|nr:SCAN domain-containing protein 3 [Trichonephila clavipes]
MDKFLSRKRTFDDNKASTSAQTSIVPKIKSRKYSPEYLNFGFTITEVNGEEKPLCVLFAQKYWQQTKLCLETILPKELQSIPLSNDTVSRRIDDISEDVEQQLFCKLRDKLFSIQLDEATDSNKDAHFIAYVRFWDADEDFSRPSECDVILGSDCFFSILRNGRITGSKGQPIAQSTIFGWVVADALKAAYASVVYAVQRNRETTKVVMLGGKSKVAPLKSIRIPRLELNGALLLARFLPLCVIV